MTGKATLDRDGQTVTVRVPLKIRRHGGRKLIIAPESAAPWASPRARIDNTMVKATARALRWRRLLEEGQYGSVIEVVEAEKINKSNISRVLRLSFLAPDIVEVILDRRQPPTLGLPMLLEPLPILESISSGGSWRPAGRQAISMKATFSPLDNDVSV
jgi:hypothetical protein